MRRLGNALAILGVALLLGLSSAACCCHPWRCNYVCTTTAPAYAESPGCPPPARYGAVPNPEPMPKTLARQ